MRTISSDLKADIANGTIARVIKITCKNGTVYGFTDTDLPITIDGLTYVPSAGLSSTKLDVTYNGQVSNQQISSAVIDLPEDQIKAGVIDNAEIECSWASWKNPSHGKIVYFKGFIGEIKWTDSQFQADVVNNVKNLDGNIGHTYTAECRHTLYGSAETGKIGYCGIDKSAFTFTGTVSSITIQKWKLTVSGFSKDDGYFDYGTLTFTSGNNAGLSVIVKEQIGNSISFMLPTAFTIAVGDTFSISAGCNKSLGTCKSKFNNVLNFGGFPHINTDVNYR